MCPVDEDPPKPPDGGKGINLEKDKKNRFLKWLKKLIGKK